MDNEDFSNKWTQMSTCKNKKYPNDKLYRTRNAYHPLYRTRNQNSNELIPEVALRLCALRETFEETGILLVKEGNETTIQLLEDFEREKWRKAIMKNPLEVN